MNRRTTDGWPEASDVAKNGLSSPTCKGVIATAFTSVPCVELTTNPVPPPWLHRKVIRLHILDPIILPQSSCANLAPNHFALIILPQSFCPNHLALIILPPIILP
jgi:hypothetical protein